MRWDLPKEYKEGEKRINAMWAFPFPQIVENKKIWCEKYWVEETYVTHPKKRHRTYWGHTKYYLWENKPTEEKKKKSTHYLDV